MTTDADWLLTPGAIRAQCGALFDLGVAGKLAHFSVDLGRLPDCAAEVVTTIRAAYPDLNVPPHARWRHFVLGGQDRWAPHAARYETPRARARAECALASLSVLLDAGAGADWSYRDPATGTGFARSEGLALASLDMVVAGAFGAAGAADLAGFGADDLAAGFQVDAQNPLAGLAGRARLISDLGAVVDARPDIFGDARELGRIADHLLALATPDLPAARILTTLLDALGPIWPATPRLEGRALGACWPHPMAPGTGLVPFHKLSQWLSYSLIEPLERAGARITGLDALTGLAEYRNGGRFLDTGVISLKTAVSTPPAPQDPLVVEWRALTVVLLDRVADLVRETLGKTAAEMPLAAVLEGGTWATGRRRAAAARPGGPPPIAIASTGTVF